MCPAALRGKLVPHVHTHTHTSFNVWPSDKQHHIATSGKEGKGKLQSVFAQTYVQERIYSDDLFKRYLTLFQRASCRLCMK